MTDRPTGEADGTQLRRRRRARRWTTKRRTLFLDALAESCNVTTAARAAQMDRSSAYDLKERDPDFARGWRKALARAHDELGLHLIARAKDGTVRTELVFDGETRQLRQIKIIRNEALTVGMRLHLSHQAETAAQRAADAGLETGAEITARVLARMNEVRTRLLGHVRAIAPPHDDDPGGDPADSAHGHDDGQ